MKTSGNGLLGSFVLVAVVIGFLLSCLTIWNTVQLQILAHRPLPSLVQLSDGRSIAVTAQAHYEREPEVIRRFVGESVQMLFTWRYTIAASLPGQSASRDPGIVLSNRARLPSSVYQAGFCLSEDLRSELLRQLAALSSRVVSGRNSQVIFNASLIGQPQPVAGQPYTWTVNVVGAQVVYSPERVEGEPIPFNKQITVRAIDAPLPVEGLLQTPLEQAVARIRASGLEIVAMRSLEPNSPS
ncbi:hypothetical protein [Gloeobacter kilaueensis]|uniref:Uncharacterized protein n=1 Tax=Gloeobacter kilaueensis (strain ATCC BAA-2537 / CCAP 1431/1 / ULC 316 / JS1) TaxID=1183438 RepID=U5QE66_GLOK1|nr:hypothetical protein [Gloeobacter kilaueensis]AGY57252.1 hypothetical protein GKIL_1006 [Gloeobacter kilaueensis JS1]